MDKENNFTIVTGASHNHFECLLNLLYSLYVFNVKARILVYDLGLNKFERSKLSTLPVDLKKFEFEKYPPYFKIIDTGLDEYGKGEINGCYAWKPVIINNVLEEYKGIVLWLDAGNLVYSNLEKVKKIIEVNGIYSPCSRENIARWTHPKTLAFLKVPRNLLSAGNRSAAVVGFNAGFSGIMDLSGKWKESALNKDCIAPEGSSLLNHRYDQAVLSILIYQFQEKYRYKLEDSIVDINTHNDRLNLGENREILLLELLIADTVI